MEPLIPDNYPMFNHDYFSRKTTGKNVLEESKGGMDKDTSLECREHIKAKLNEQNYLSRRNTRIFDTDKLEV